MSLTPLAPQPVVQGHAYNLHSCKRWAGFPPLSVGPDRCRCVRQWPGQLSCHSVPGSVRRGGGRTNPCKMCVSPQVPAAAHMWGESVSCMCHPPEMQDSGPPPLALLSRLLCVDGRLSGGHCGIETTRQPGMELPASVLCHLAADTGKEHGCSCS